MARGKFNLLYVQDSLEEIDYLLERKYLVEAESEIDCFEKNIQAIRKFNKLRGFESSNVFYDHVLGEVIPGRKSKLEDMWREDKSR
jgi:hypothetical protein